MRASRWLTYGSYTRSPAGAAAVSGPSGASRAPVTAGLAASEWVSMWALVIANTVVLPLCMLAI